MRRMFQSQAVFGGLLMLAVFGCTPPEPEKSACEVISAANSLADTLQGVNDAESARAAIDALDAAFRSTVQAQKTLLKHKDAKMLATRAQELKQEQERANSRIKTEMDRLRKVRGLPVEFWKVLHLRSLEVLAMALEVPGLPDCQREAICKVRDFSAKYDFEQTVALELTNLPGSLQAKAIEHIKKAAPRAEVQDNSGGGENTLWVAPVADFRAFVASLDLGKVVFEDESQRRVEIEVDRRKLGARANSDEEERELFSKEMREDMERSRQEAERERQQRAEEEKKKRLDPNAPDYYEKLADRMLSASRFEQDEAVDRLLVADPAKVASAETRAKIARGFKHLAETSHFDTQRKSVRGLVVWGGKFSVPILLNMLDDHNPFVVRDVMKALGDLKDERAAAPLAARLSDFRHRDAAQGALRNMGSAAEDALIEIAPTNDAAVCLIAVNLLGEVGTSKSFKVLRQGLTSRNPEVRLASKNAIARINTRKPPGAEKEQE